MLVTTTTFRMGGHATHDEAEARRNLPGALFEYWGERDPLGTYEEWLVRSQMPLEEGLESLGLAAEDLPEERPARNRAVLERVGQAAEDEVELAAEDALHSRAHDMPDGSDVDVDVFAEPTE